MRTFILRHGETLYAQGNIPVPIAEATDIKESAKPILRASAKEIYKRSENKSLEIRASPVGRTLASAKEVRMQLQELGALTTEIIPDSRLQEVHGFDYAIMLGLVEGTPIHVDGEKYILDKKSTNPQNLSPTRFYRSDIMHDANYQRRLPQKLAQRILQMETCQSMENRLENVLASLTREAVLVTHEGSTGPHVVAFTGNREAYLDRGYFIELEKRNGLFRPTYMNQPGNR